jgi:DNA-binding response OmpR family regulator
MAKRILHVEDDEDICNLVKTLLEEQECEVTSAFTGREALDRLKSEKFDLILLSIMLPDMSGWDIFHRMREIFYPGKVAFLSVMPLPDDELVELKEAGISDYMRKPFDNEDLIRRVRNILKINRTVLHIEDDEDTRDLVKMLLETQGYRVLTASSGEEGLNRLRGDVDLVLLDVMLPDVCGWTIFQKIRKDPCNRNLKVAFLSIIPISGEQLMEFGREGVLDYITKPFDNTDLVGRIDRIFEIG